MANSDWSDREHGPTSWLWDDCSAAHTVLLCFPHRAAPRRGRSHKTSEPHKAIFRATSPTVLESSVQLPATAVLLDPARTEIRSETAFR